MYAHTFFYPKILLEPTHSILLNPIELISLNNVFESCQSNSITFSKRDSKASVKAHEKVFCRFSKTFLWIRDLKELQGVLIGHS